SRLLCGDEVCSEDEVCIDNQCRCLPPAYCSNERQLVCGSDGNTYGNMCRLNATRCFYGTDIEKVSDGMCPDYSCETHDCNNDEECFINENDEPDCRCKDYCDDDFDPVCATDGILYDNRCKFRVHRCRTDEDIAIDDTGSSCEPEQEDVDDSCTRSCSPDTVSVACQRVVDQECFVLIGILDTKYEDNSQTFYEINVTQAVGHQKPPVNGSPVYLYGPSRKDDGCLCPPIEEINNMYVIFGSKDNFRFIVENYNFAAILDEDMSEQLKRECAIYFSSN
ncbi:tomoregulin-1-like, partial [Saccoglossus kowalevskii]|uniref:Ovoinhibitor-like n=1 Tax=Saccoglossus kowalevskii TaxID=10224 RepID=A0ABM0MB27_SACKO